LARKNNRFVNLEIENICREVSDKESNKTESNGGLLIQKVEDIEKKFDFLIKENKELKNLIQTKTKNICKIHTSMNLFRKEIANLKTQKITYKKKSVNKKSTFNKSNKFKKSNQLDKEMEDLLKLGNLII
jgi:hypothetical protein